MNVKPGDIARCINSMYPENINAIVLVLYAGNDPAPLWACEALQPLKGWFCGQTVYVPPGKKAFFLDKDLRRVEPPDEDLTEENLECLLTQLETQT